MVGEAVQGGPALGNELASENPIVALVEEGPSLLAGPRRRQPLDLSLTHFDLLRHLSPRQFHLVVQSFELPRGDIMAEQDAVWLEHVPKRVNDRPALGSSAADRSWTTSQRS